ncbi:MAG: aminopeptidase, partial [Woeseiaceae bacterium]|nr:aminopeptidase [Woeseiaceae bacterium]
MPKRIYPILLLVFLLGACAEEAPSPDPYDPAHDYFSFSNTEQFLTQHLALDLSVDFEAQQLRGSATLSMQKLDSKATDIVLDTRDLAIQAVEFLPGDGAPISATYRFGDSDPIKGTPLIVELPAGAEAVDEVRLRLHYATSPNSTALQWLPPALTAGGEQPLMFSQSQSIHARSWVPLQDTPAVRITYEAHISTPPQLLAVMSANNDPETPRRGDYRFVMPQPIPSY